ncbi:hypothetical protein KKH23_01680 [Patescibacteria group bacterium]|nr:hypothetical protein [Patescibacteria group bacterium]MBU0777198.1 hypothetical protein [Patescibacteria group bacterium]MBU0845893.1 hypothetical protein [Patescibacteria group bacterium]MBU0922920.1 hypothetical protein [Patescibacteria group bacterium]MBU1066347.1 hypothetical protein [Patescibacteria group bacterium]
MSGGEGKELSRRGALKVAALGIGVAAAIEVVDFLSEKKWDLNNPKRLEEFIGGKELFPGYHSYFVGKVFVREGASIHSAPTVWKNQPEKGLVTTNMREETEIEGINEGEEFFIENPYIVLREADEQSTSKAEIVGPNGEKKMINPDANWLVFPATPEMPEKVRSSINGTLYGLGCIRIGAGDITFQKEGEETMRFVFDTSSIVFKERHNLGK